MEDLSELSNEELQYRLTQFGFPTLPVTSSTRQLLVKRLQRCIEGEKQKLRRNTEYATRYSSDEDLSASSKKSPDEPKARSFKGRSRSTIAGSNSKLTNSSESLRNRSNVNMPAPSLSPPTQKLSVNLWTDKTKNDNAAKAKKQGSPTIYISPLIQHDTDEESDSQQTDGLNTSFSNRYNKNLSISISPQRPLNPRASTSSIYNGHEAAAVAAAQSDLIAKNRYSNHSLENGSFASSTANNSMSASSESSTNGDHDNDDLASPYSSTNFTKRLLSLRNRNIGSAMNAPLLADRNTRFDHFTPPMLSYPSSRMSRYLNESPASRLSMLSRDHSIIYQAANVESNNQKPFSLRRSVTQFFSRCYERYSVKQSLVPCILLSALFMFFTSVIIAYLTMNPDLSLALDAKAATYKLCPEFEASVGNAPTLQPTINCIESDQLEPAFNLLKLVIPELQKRIEFNRCTDSSAVFTMSAKEIIQFVLEQQQQHIIDVSRALHNAEYLITMNPQWRVGNFIDSSGQSTASISLQNLSRLRASQSYYFAIVKPRLPVSCFLYNKLQAVFIIIGWIAVIGLIVYIFVFIVRFIRSHLQTRRERVTNMVEEIKNVLMEKAYDPDTACTDAASVVINHLRDKLIPPAERSRMENVWNAALRLLESDSRIQFSVATRNGEDYRVMRWIDTVSPQLNQNAHSFSSTSPLIASTNSNVSAAANTSSCNLPTALSQRACSTPGTYGTVKKWQSPAFDKSNKIKDPPTECLKIRQMFDKHESSNPNLKQIIQDAILEKVAHTPCKIYDIQLDKQTCCVYVRCASAKDAGIIHDEVNGWWFDSRLVSIKFLRLDRYLNRFPNSASASGPACLKPSNTKKLSMTNSEGENGTHQNGKRNADSLTDYEDDDDDDDYDDNREGL